MSTAPSEKADSTGKGERKVTPFVDWLAKHQRGSVDTELTYELRQLIEAVQDTGKKGELVLKLTVKHDGEGRVIVAEDVKTTLPKPTRRDSVYFVDQHLNLLRDPPGQGNLLKLNNPAARAAESDGDE